MKTAMNEKMGPVSTLTDFYEALLAKHFSGIEPMSADEMLMEHGWRMTDDQKRALAHFIGLWELVVESHDF